MSSKQHVHTNEPIHQSVIPHSWITPLDLDLQNLKQQFSRGYYELALTDSLVLRFEAQAHSFAQETMHSSADIATRVQQQNTECRYFVTQFGTVTMENVSSFFEMLANLPYDADYPLGIEKWLRICLHKAPETFVNLWQYLVPCQQPIIAEQLPINMTLIEHGSGVSSTIWAPKEALLQLIQSPYLQHVLYPLEKSEIAYRIDLSLCQTTIEERELSQLATGDLLLVDRLLISEEGIGEFRTFNKQVQIHVNTEETPPQVQIISIHDVDESTLATQNSAVAGRLTSIKQPRDNPMHDLDDDAEDITFDQVLESGISTDDEPMPRPMANPTDETDNETFSKSYAQDEYEQQAFAEEPHESLPEENLSELDTSAEEHQENINALGCAKITIDACLGSFVLDFNQIQNLQEGHLIQLASEYNGKISLRNNGTEIGIGSIVAVNDQLAIQIEKLWR